MIYFRANLNKGDDEFGNKILVLTVLLGGMLKMVKEGLGLGREDNVFFDI